MDKVQHGLGADFKHSQEGKHSMIDANRSVAQAPGYSILQIGLHWLIAAIVLFQLVFGESMTEAFDAAEEGQAVSAFDQQFATLHYWAGIIILILVALRLALRFAQGVPEIDQTLPGWMLQASTATHWAFYILLVGVPVTGLLGYYVDGPYGDIHAWAKPVFIALIALHVLAALYHQFVRRDGLLLRMLAPK
jgi:cytochrome b561